MKSTTSSARRRKAHGTEPGSLLIARDLEAESIPVNVTSTFSARQVVAAALLGDVTRSNVFMGRLNQGFHAALLGEPDSCVRRSEDILSRRGAGALLVAKFIPGLHSVAQPLAGALGMRRTMRMAGAPRLVAVRGEAGQAPSGRVS